MRPCTLRGQLSPRGWDTAPGHLPARGLLCPISFRSAGSPPGRGCDFSHSDLPSPTGLLALSSSQASELSPQMCEEEKAAVFLLNIPDWAEGCRQRMEETAAPEPCPVGEAREGKELGLRGIPRAPVPGAGRGSGPGVRSCFIQNSTYLPRMLAAARGFA